MTRKSDLIDLAHKAGLEGISDRLTVAQIEAVLDAHYAEVGEQVVAEHVAAEDAGPRPLWEAGETHQQYHERLAAWKARRDELKTAAAAQSEPFPA